MKKLLIASAATVALTAGPALAADMPLKAPPPPPAAAYSWTGFYLNGGGGYGMWASDTTVVATGVPCTFCFPLPVTQTQGGKGWFGRIGGGYDYQFSDHIVAGLLADWDFSSISGTIQDQNPGTAGTIKENYSWAAGARIGWLVTPQTLTYVNGGYTQTHFTSADMVFAFSGGPAGAATGFSTPAFSQSGWFLGGGLETPLAPILPAGWFLRSEYRYSYFGTANLPDTCPGVSGSAACGFTVSPQGTITFHPTVQTISTELVYRFNWSGTGSALAADRPNAAPVVYKATPAPVAAYSWTGFYLNGGGGYGLWSADTTTFDPVTGLCAVCVTERQGGKGWFGRIGGGYDYQFSDRIVAGLLADWDFSSISGTIQDESPFLAGTIKEDYSWAAGARIGWLVTPQTLTYVNGGYSQTHFDSANMVFTGPFPVPGASSGFSTPAFSQSGWFVGGGVETPLAPILPAGWFLRTEYRYANYGTKNLPDTCSAGCAFFPPLNTITFQPTVQTVSTEIVYRFNWPGPVSTKY